MVCEEEKECEEERERAVVCEGENESETMRSRDLVGSIHVLACLWEALRWELHWLQVCVCGVEGWGGHWLCVDGSFTEGVCVCVCQNGGPFIGSVMGVSYRST